MSDDKKNLKKLLDHPELRHKKNEFNGFEEVLDLIPRGRLPGKQTNPKMNEDFELLNLLENEVVRLEKLELFFNEKLKISKKFNQVSPMVEKQIIKNDEIRSHVINYSVTPESPFRIKLSRIFQSAFSKGN